ncbi:hypothetical protein E4U44_005226 [Claviceps purpurea]|nr:hypothetical protein E4U44_005226 [Claviceps purpurea]
MSTGPRSETTPSPVRIAQLKDPDQIGRNLIARVVYLEVNDLILAFDKKTPADQVWPIVRLLTWLEVISDSG